MGTYRFTPDKRAVQKSSKVDYLIRPGRFSETQTMEYIFRFDLNSTIKSGLKWLQNRLHLFLFGSADSLLNSKKSKSEAIAALPFKTFLERETFSVDSFMLTVWRPLTPRKWCGGI